jgi:hypothetical protein
MNIVSLGILSILLVVPTTAGPLQQAPPPLSTPRAVATARALFFILDDSQRAKIRLPLNAKTRSNWSNLPTGTTFQNGATERNGLKLGDMTAVQQEAALALVAATLSPSGFEKVMNIVNADETLERNSAPTRCRKPGSLRKGGILFGDSG